MTTAGIVGGIGPESTIEYYRHVIAGYRARCGDQAYPHLIINSINLTELMGTFATGDVATMASILIREISALAAAGADFAVIAANTPHLAFDRVAAASPIPVISIVEVARDAVASRGMRRVGLFGTKFTMQARLYPDVFARHGIDVVAPPAADQDVIHEIYFRDLVGGVVRPEARQALVEIAERMHDRDRVEGILLAGTELSLILQDGQARVPFLDTSHLHAARIVDEMVRSAAVI